MSSLLEIRSFEIQAASEADYAALNQHSNLLRKERMPDDPPIPLEETIKELNNIPSYVDLKRWCVWDTFLNQVLAEGSVQLLKIEENKHLAQFDITVQPTLRRQGWGRKLLGLITGYAQAQDRRLLVAQTYDCILGGEAFMKRLGAQKGMEGHINQLRIADLDRQLLEDWLQRGQSLASEFELGIWEGPYPEQQLPAIAQLFELTNQQPFGELEIEDMHMTSDQIRQMDKLIFSRGSQRWTFYIVEKSTGKFVGYTETVWNPNRPELLNQDMTGVFPEYRKKGLGRWLKAAMLDKVVKERPQVKFVRTNNADVNAAMLKINNELGFYPYMAGTFWQVDISKVLAYLSQDM